MSLPSFRTACLLAVFSAAIVAVTFAQERRPVEPAVYRKPLKSNSTEESRPPGLRKTLPRAAEIPLPALSADDLADLEVKAGTESTGVHRSLAKSGLEYRAQDNRQGMRMDGAWVVSPDGAPVWRLMIHSEGAAGVRVHFTDFSVANGGVWVHDGKEASAARKRFQERGPWGDGEFWSQVVFSDTVYVEYEPEDLGATGRDVPFQIEEISPLWRTPGMDQRPNVIPPPALPEPGNAESAGLSRHLRGRLPANATPPRGTAPGAPAEGSLTPVPQAGACQVDVTCYPQWAETASSVALIFFETGTGSASCSGTLLNTRNQSFTPYFLTAAHCIGNAGEARTVEAFWFYQSSACNGTPPKTYQVPSALGARQVKRLGDFNSRLGDFNLLVLEEVPGGVVFSGWDPNPVPVGTNTAGIHHPDSEHKRITFGRTVTDIWYGSSDAYMIVDEFSGRTESGSSGSGLFSAPNILIGALSFGPALSRGQTACNTSPYLSGYGKFSKLYPEVSQYLEDTLPPPPDADTPLESGVPRGFSLPSVFFPTLFDYPMFRVVAPDNAVELLIEMDAATSGSDVDMYVRHGQPPLLSGGEVIADFVSENPGGVESIVINGSTSPPIRPGTYYIAFVQWTRFKEVAGSVTATLTLENFVPDGPPRLNALVNGATQLTGAIAPGEIVTLYGVNLGPETGIESRLTAEGRLPTVIQDVRVLFNEVPAPLFYVSAGQINAQVPYEVAGTGTIDVRVSHSGGMSASLPVGGADSAPGIFMYLDGGDRAVAINQDGSLNSPANPEARNRVVVLYATGEGLTTPRATTGVPVSEQLPLPVPVLPVKVRIGGIDAALHFAGAPVGFSGLMQVNAVIPANAPVGQSVPLVLTVGETSSATVAIAIQ